MICIRDMSFGRLLRNIRANSGVTLRDHSRRTGLDPGNISRTERNLIPPPASIRVLYRYLDHLDYNQHQFDELKTACINHHIAKVLERFKL